MWHQMGINNGRVFESIVDDFNRSQDDVHVKLVDQSAEISSLPKFKAGLTTGDLPDVIQLEETALQTMIDSGATVPVQACVDADHYSLADFLPKVTGYYTVQDVLRSMPYNPSNPILFYDKTRFAKAGLDPEPPAADARRGARVLEADRRERRGQARHLAAHRRVLHRVLVLEERAGLREPRQRPPPAGDEGGSRQPDAARRSGPGGTTWCATGSR